MKIGICEDEPILLQDLGKLVSLEAERIGEKAVIKLFPNGESLLKGELGFDLYLLDIQMKGCSGLECAQELRRRGEQGTIVFTTVLQEFALEAFRVEALDYIVKPVTADKIRRVLERVQPPNCEERLFFQRGRGLEWEVIPWGKIEYCEVIKRKLFLHSSEGILEFYGKLEELEKEKPKYFYRCHRSYLVNLRQVAAFREGDAFLRNGEQIPVSRLREAGFKEAMLEELKG